MEFFFFFFLFCITRSPLKRDPVHNKTPIAAINTYFNRVKNPRIEGSLLAAPSKAALLLSSRAPYAPLRAYEVREKREREREKERGASSAT